MYYHHQNLINQKILSWNQIQTWLDNRVKWKTVWKSIENWWLTSILYFACFSSNLNTPTLVYFWKSWSEQIRFTHPCSRAYFYPYFSWASGVESRTLLSTPYFTLLLPTFFLMNLPCLICWHIIRKNIVIIIKIILN